MKNLFNKLFLFALTGSFIFLYSCGEDEPEPTTDAPSIDFSVTGGTLNATMDTVFVDFGGTIDWTFNITAPGGFNTFRLSGAVTAEFTRTDLGLDAGATSATVSASTGPWNQVGNFTITATAVDDVDTGQTSSADVVVSVSGVPAEDQAVSLGVVLGDLTGQAFYSVSRATKYSPSEVTSTSEAISADIDFGYYYGSSDNATIATPAAFETSIFSAQVEGWNVKNATTLKTTDLSNTDFIEVTTVSQIETAFDAGTLDDNGIISGLAANQVIAFETVGGVKGLILVESITGTDGSDGAISLQLKVEPSDD
jgi:hypothetical protein